jgi:hypothetical protein
MRTFYKICLFIAGAGVVGSILWLIDLLRNRPFGYVEAQVYFFGSLVLLIIQLVVNAVLLVILLRGKKTNRLEGSIKPFIMLALMGLVITLVSAATAYFG